MLARYGQMNIWNSSGNVTDEEEEEEERVEVEAEEVWQQQQQSSKRMNVAAHNKHTDTHSHEAFVVVPFF